MQTWWSLAKGDPSTAGSLTVIAYFATAAFCWWLSTRRGSYIGEQLRENRQWRFISTILFVLGVNKTFDLLSMITGLLRDSAWSYDWYEQRHKPQMVVIILLVIIASMIVLSFVRLRQYHLVYRISFAAIIWLCFFVILRAISIHETDALISIRFYGLRMNWVLELGGIVFVMASATVTMIRTAL